MFGRTNYKALCLELQGNIDNIALQNRQLSNKLVAQEVLLAKQKTDLADKQIWIDHLVEQNHDLTNRRRAAKIALDNYTRELEKC